jgi:hypothetical protein
MTIERIETGARMSEVVIHSDAAYLAGSPPTGKSSQPRTCAPLAQFIARALASEFPPPSVLARLSLPLRVSAT